MTSNIKNLELQVPKQFQLESFRFIECNKGSKIPLGSLHKEEDQKTFSNLDTSKNVALICGINSIRCIDIDDPIKYNKDVKDFDTFVVKTSKGYHVYFFSDYETNHYGESGEVRCKDLLVTIPPSTHASGDKYEVYCDKPIRHMPSNLFKLIIKPFLEGKKVKEGRSIVKACSGDMATTRREFGLCIEHCKRGIAFRNLKGLRLEQYVRERMNEYDKFKNSNEGYKNKTIQRSMVIAERKIKQGNWGY